MSIAILVTIAFIASCAHSLATFFRSERKFSEQVFHISFVNSWMFAFFLGLLCYSQWLSPGRELIGAGLALPGSLITRFIYPDLSPVLHRAFQAYYLFFFCFLVASAAYSRRSFWFEFSSLLLAIIHGMELVYLSNLSFVISNLLYEAVQIGFLGSLIAAFSLNSISSGPSISQSRYPFLSLLSVVLVSVCIVFLQYGSGDRVAPESPKIGAHYYSWFPENWVAGFIGEQQTPEITPALGRYNSGQQSVFEQHLAWASESGIDFFVFDWWPTRVEIDQRLKENLSVTELPQGFEYALQYESLDVKENDPPAFKGESVNEVFLTEKRAWRLKKHWEYLAKTYMKSENYLRIKGRPVLFLYASRHFVGPVFSSFMAAKAHVLETTGEDIFLVGDEAFYNVLSFSRDKGLFLLADLIPDWSRLAAFDALTAYNPLDPKGEQKTASTYIDQFSKLYSEYENYAHSLGQQFIPTILPGYNDRGVRPDEGNVAISRDAELENDFLNRSLRELGYPFLDSQNPIMMITSWNEWNEGTQIEPSTQPEGSSKLLKSTPFAYEGYGRRHLETIEVFSKEIKKN